MINEKEITNLSKFLSLVLRHQYITATSLLNSFFLCFNLTKQMNKTIFIKRLIISISLIAFIQAGVCQNAVVPGPAAISADSANIFPGTFLGRWKGELQWMRAGKPGQQFQMQLIILPADSVGVYTWQIIYGEQGKDNRPYLLKPINKALGHWSIDEQNGILLDGYLHGNSFHGAFTVGDNTIVDNYRVEGDSLFVEFFTIRLNDKKNSGKGTEESPRVQSYRMSGYQLGVLHRTK